MNDFGFIDYQRPVGQKNDYRTSSYLGHVYWNDTVSTHAARRPIRQQLPNEPKDIKDTLLETEHMEQYPRKSSDTCILRNPPVKQRRANYIKAYEDARLRNVPKLIQEQRSTYNSDFRHELPITPENHLQYNMPSALKNALLTEINRSKPGYANILDSKSTSQRVDYPPYSTEQQLGIGAKDHITFWNWIKEDHGKRNVRIYKENMCEHRNRCISRRNEFLTETKPVPHNGLTTETRSNYAPPVRSSREELTVGLNQTFNCTPWPLQNFTENKIYGSGECLDKYINTQATRQHVLIKQ